MRGGKSGRCRVRWHRYGSSLGGRTP
eukprot:COSAG05_NODE_18153_length_313_cov_0.471963_2_plen_25_part_01